MRGITFTPSNNLLRQLVYAETGSNLDFVIVDGQIVMRDGVLTRIDEMALIDEIKAEHEKLLPQMIASKKEVESMREPMERIYMRCQQIDIAEDTHPARLPS
jgi:guanine deaminase